jgi:hypothetical protein
MAIEAGTDKSPLRPLALSVLIERVGPEADAHLEEIVEEEAFKALLGWKAGREGRRSARSREGDKR